jgi:hypothetical protein
MARQVLGGASEGPERRDRGRARGEAFYDVAVALDALDKLSRLTGTGLPSGVATAMNS